MNVSDCWTNELEFQICTNCKNIHCKVQSLQTAGKSQRQLSTFANVCYFFTINAFINVYFYYYSYWTFNTSIVIR